MPVLRLNRKRIAPVVGLATGLMLLNPWGGLSSAATRPDFVVTSVTNPPATALPGASFSIDFTVVNQGTVANATASLTQISTKFYLVVGNTKKNLKGGVQMLDLPFGAAETRTRSLTVEVYSDTAAGTYDLQACADADGDISEGSGTPETNNCTIADGTITVLQAPDLIISSISNPPSSGGQGQPITVKDDREEHRAGQRRSDGHQVQPGLDRRRFEDRSEAAEPGGSDAAAQARPDVHRAAGRDRPAGNRSGLVSLRGLRRRQVKVLVRGG